MAKRKKKSNRNANNIGAEMFIREWQKSDSLADLCKKLGMSAPAARLRAAAYRRKHKVKLKHFAPAHRGAVGYNWAYLRKLALTLSK